MIIMMIIKVFCLGTFLVLVSGDTKNHTEVIYFESHIWPILQAYARPHLLMFTDVLWISHMEDGYTHLTDKSVEVPRMCRITPCDPENSYLLHKIQGTHLDVGGVGLRMPLEMPPLNQHAIDTVKTWILQGARYTSMDPRGKDCNATDVIHVDGTNTPPPTTSTPSLPSAGPAPLSGTTIAVVMFLGVASALVVRQLFVWCRARASPGGGVGDLAYAPVNLTNNDPEAAAQASLALQQQQDVEEYNPITTTIDHDVTHATLLDEAHSKLAVAVAIGTPSAEAPSSTSGEPDGDAIG